MINWGEILTYLIEAIIAIVIPYGFVLLRSKIKNETALKLVNEAQTFVVNCVMMVEQTFVLPMKAGKTWNDETKAEAFAQCKEQVLSMLSEEMVKSIELIYKDVDQWCQAQIETSVLALRIEEQ